MPQHLPPPDEPDDGTTETAYVRLDPDLDHRGSPLRRALRAAGLRAPFGIGRRPTPLTNRPDDTEEQETTS